MKKLPLIILAAILQAGCATSGMPPARQPALLDFEQIAAEIQVRHEIFDAASPQSVSAAAH